MANVFDWVRHYFLFAIMEKMGFNNDILNWIQACINSMWISLLVNGNRTKFFQATRGLQQGCPLSPLLYIIMDESLSKKLEYERLEGNLSGLSIVRNIKTINHSQFADDTLLLGGASKVIVGRFKKVLDSYLSLSRGFINKRKSKINGWNFLGDLLRSIYASIEFPFSCNWSSFKYVGIPISLGSYSRTNWEEVVQKFKTKI